MIFVYEYKGYFLNLRKDELSELYAALHQLSRTLEKNPSLNYIHLRIDTLDPENQFTVEIICCWESTQELDFVSSNKDFSSFIEAWKITRSTYKISAIEETNNRKLSKSWFSNSLNPRNIQILYPLNISGKELFKHP
ncbi:MAG: hypothetical protein V6D39_17770 [Dolichospermum lemmermannii FEM_B0920]